MWRKRLPAPKVKWIHNCWDLQQVLNRRVDPKEKIILQALIHLRAGVSYTQAAKLVKRKRADLVRWANLYNQGFGLDLLVKPVMIVNPMFDRRIKSFLKENPSQYNSLLSGTDNELYADWAEVPSEILAAWIKQQEYYGLNQQISVVSHSKRRYTKRTRKSNDA